MTLQAINAQALRPAVNFKAQEAEAPVAAIKTADDSSAKAKHTTAKVQHIIKQLKTLTNIMQIHAASVHAFFKFKN